MLSVVWIPLVLQLLVPLGLLAWLALGRPTSRSSWALRAVLTIFYLGAIAGAGLWLVLPWYTPVAYAATLVLVLVWSSRRVRAVALWPLGWRAWAGALCLGAAAAGCGGLLIRLARSRRAPAGAVELSFPLHSGSYLVVNGGGGELINAHLKTLAGERFGPFRGQSYGVDIEKLRRSGLRARGILPRDPAAYAIFGDSVYAPCAGTVITALDGVPEMRPPEMDRRHMAGNHVILRCGSAWVVLGHMRQGSVAVRAGEWAVVGALLGRVGNTGNTTEPHLHVHAQRPGTTAAPLSGEPLPIRFGPIYPVRNTRIGARTPAEQLSARASP